MPLSLHILTGRGGVQFDTRRILYGYMKLPQEVQLTFADMIAGGCSSASTPQSGLSRK